MKTNLVPMINFVKMSFNQNRLYACITTLVLLFILGISNAWAGSSDYARGYATVSSSSPSGAGKVYVNYTSSGGTQPSTPSSGSGDWKTAEASKTAEGSKTTFDFYYYSLPASGYAIEGWSETNGASDYSNAVVAKYSITTSSSSLNDAYTDVRLYAHFVPNPTVTVTFLTPDSKCTYTAQCDGANVAIGSSKTTNKSFNLAVTVNDANYKLLGWYTTTDGGVTKSYFSPNTTYTNKYFPQTCSVGVDLVEAGKPVFMVGDKLFTDLNAANSAASSGSNKTIVLVSDGILDAGNYTISNGNTLLIPHTIGSTFVNSRSVVDAPYIVRTATTLSAFRKLTLQDGVNITVNGKICVAGKMMSAGGGKASAYPTGECGVIDMSTGGNITLNTGSILYCWGFIKGQDMDQGNNTSGVGTITANSGSVIWEGFATGDWRGGTASSTIYSNASSWKFFPFQSYTIQNIEVPVTYNYNSKLSNYMSIFGDGQVYNGTFDLIGSSNTLFKLSDSGSKLKKWYDPTTDLVCYEMSGTTQLDALNVEAAGETVSSKDYNLPISTSMHIILASNTTISKPVEIQAGAVIEIKSGVTATCSSNVYMFDKDEWGEYCYTKYYYTMSNLSIHKDRGNGKSNELIDDAKFIVDGTLNISGKLYTTNGGADIMGNGGGKVTFGTLGSATNIVMCTGTADNENVAINQGNLHNEDDTYTKAIASTTFHNVNGRWFTAAAKDGKANHTYDFTYISSGAVSGTGGTSTTTDAVYSNDKTGLDARMKWFNVTADACANWWQGKGEQSAWFYNWTLNNAWHQFIPTEMENVYSGSNNKLYEKSSCTWGEIGDADVNCLYEIGGVKKALVDGEFIALEANNNDPAYHAADDATQYYICFAGCNWHAADKYTEAEKAYVVDEEIFIWYDNAWMNVDFKQPFAYTIDETNVPVYYEYTDGEWVLAEPYVRVVDGFEDRSFWFFKDAFTFANSALRANPTITILRDVSATTAAWSYTATNKKCTLDLNGKKVTLTVTGSGTSEIKMFQINASGTTFTITDNSDGAKGELRLIASPNTATQSKRWHGVYLTDGTLVLNAGKVYAEDEFTYTSTSNTGMVSGITIAAGKTFTMNGGTLDAYAKYNVIGVQVNGAAGADATVKIKGGTIHAETTHTSTVYGMYIAGGTTTITGGKIEARSKTTTAIGVALLGNKAGYYGTLKVQGGEIEAFTTTTTAYGIQVGEGIAYSSGNIISNRVLSKATISSGTIRATSTTTKSSSHTVGVRSYGTTEITGGTIECNATQSIAYGVYAVSGTTTISGNPTIIARAPTYAYGACAGLAPASKTGVPYNGNLVISGGHFEVSATTTTYAYGVLVQALGTSVNYSTSSGYYPGNYVSVGSATISGGEFDVQAHTTTAYGIFVKGAITQSGAKLDADGNLADPVTSAPPTCTVSGGKYKVSGTGSVYATNDAAVIANYQISGGYYSHDNNLANYTAAPKHVLSLPADDVNRPDYAYKVADAYQVVFKNGDDVLQSTYQESGKTPVYEGETPTKASTSSESYIFDGWSTTDGGSVVSPLPNVTSAGATYYAHYNTTTLKYIVTLDATTNGGSCGTDKIYVEPSAAVGELPVATKTGYTFNGWYTAASGGTKLESTTPITADGTYYAQFTINNYTLTWELDGGKVTTEGKYGSTKWPAKNATGTQSRAIPYGSTLTAPVVTRTGYTFQMWNPLVAGTMPAEAATYTAIWTPKTNTVYTVKHYLLNVDGSCPVEPYETESLTGTTATSVTPAVKSYDGFNSPSTQTAIIAADGSMVVVYQYERKHYTFILDAATNGGTSDLPSIEVIHGATIGAVPPDAQKGCNDFTGWFTKPVGGVKITSSFVIEYDMKKLYAQFSDDIRTYSITYLAGANGTGTITAGTKTCDVDAVLSSSTFTRVGYTQTGWSTTDGGTKAYDLGGTYTANAALTLYPFWTIHTHALTWNFDGGTPSGSYTAAGNAIAYGTVIEYPTLTKTGYTFASWSSSATTMPDNDLTITATWTPNTNTPYVVKHYQQNIDNDEYTEVTADRQNLTGTTDAEVTPVVNSYIGFTAPDAQTVTILPNGSRVVEYYYTRNSYQLTWNANEGELSGTYTSGSVKYGAPITTPSATRDNYHFDGWDEVPAATMPAEDKTYTAQWSLAAVTILWKSEDGTSTLETDDLVLIGSTPSFDSAEPTKATTEAYTYTFDGWTTEVNGAGTFYAIGELPEVTAAATYYAHFSATANVASVTVSGTTTYYATIDAAFAYTNTVSANMEIKLMKDATASASLVYKPKSTYTCTLDLNNHTISGTVDKLINVNLKNAKLIITDKSGPKGGKISTKHTLNGTLSCVYITAGKVDLNAGTIECINTRKYSSSSSYKNTAAAGVIVASSSARYFTMNGGTIKVNATYRAHGVYSYGTTAIKGGEIYVSDQVEGVSGSTGTIYGVYATTAKTTISGDATINVNATVKNAYGACAAGNTPSASGTVYNGTIEITGGTFNVSAPATAVGVYSIAALKKSSSDASVYYHSHGTANVKGGTFNVSTTSTTTAIGVYVNRGLIYSSTMPNTVTQEWPAQANITGGTFNITTTPNGTTTAEGVRSMGTTIISGGTFDISSQTESAYGVRVYAGTTTINDATVTPTFTISAPLYAFGVTAGETPADKTGAPYNGVVTIDAGSFDINATGAGTAYGIYAKAARRKITSTSSGYYIGAYASAGTAIVNGGTFDVNATTTAIGVVVVAKSGYAKFTQSGVEYPAAYATPYAEVNGGNFVMASTSDANATAYAMNASATVTDFLVKGGYYNTKRTNASATSVIEDKYTAPSKTSCNYRVLENNEANNPPYLYKVAEAYQITFNNDNGNQLQQSYQEKGTTPVYSGETPTKDADAQYTYTFDDWTPAITNVTAAATYTATFTQTVNTYTITWLDGNGETLKTEDVAYGETPSYSGETPTKTEDANYTYTFNGTWSPAIVSVTEDATYTAQFDAVSKETGSYLDIIDWTTTSLTINANGWTASGWPYTINDISYEKEARAADRTLTISYSGAAGTELRIKVEDKDDNVISLRKYRIPFIGTTEGAGEEDIVYVNSGTLEIDASTTPSLAGLYVRPEAGVEITGGTLSVGKLVLRTLPWQAAAISGDFDADEVWYTRIAPNKRTITGPDANITYEAASYYQFALPLNCTAPLKDIQVSHGANTPYGSTWLLKRYDEPSRADNGAGSDNWIALESEDYIQGGVGYEMFSNSAYYREFYFPLGAVSSASLGTTTAVSYTTGGAAGEKHAGWNIVASPLMGVYDNSDANPETGMKVSWLMTDGSYDQCIPSAINPAIPFSYQASKSGNIYFNDTELKALLPQRRVAAEDEPVRIQWIHVDVKDADGIGDHTSVLVHPTRYEETYKTGIDVAKQSFEASRALLYSTHAYGEMAFAGVSDELLEKGVALTLFSPAEQKLTISMRENKWLDRMAYVWLVDKETGARTDLLMNDYRFIAPEGTTTGRFYIEGRFKAPEITTGLENSQSDEVQGTKARKILVNDKMYIEVNGKLYDATGKLVISK